VVSFREGMKTMTHTAILLLSTVFFVQSAEVTIPYKLDEAFCRRYSDTQGPTPGFPDYHYRACLKLEEWAKTHPADNERCLTEPSRGRSPDFAYALCIQSARSKVRIEQRRQCEKEAEKAFQRSRLDGFIEMRKCEALTMD
jgi:hypothetical protein